MAAEGAAVRRRSTRVSTAAAAKASAEAMAPPPVPSNKRRRKSSEADVAAAATVSEAAPSTPKRKRLQPNGAPPPLTPTPSAVGLIAQPADGKTAKARHDTVNRLADPKLTNATLLSPETSRVVASRDVELVSPSKLPGRRTTTRSLLQEACDHLIKVDERMRPLVEQNHCHLFSPEGLQEKIDPFESLTSGIISQQVSGAAAKSIKAKFVALFSNDRPDYLFPPPSEVAACSIERLRSAGLSQRKAEYIKGLGEKFASKEITAQMLHDAPYEQILETLTAVRGLGRWSVEMFACFGLKRMDVFSLGDLGVQRGMAAFVGRDVAKLRSKGGKWKYMSEMEMTEISDKFAPYRTLFMWYMWRTEKTDVSTME